MKIEPTSGRKSTMVEKLGLPQFIDEKSDEETTSNTPASINTMPKPQRCVNAEEAAHFLGLKDKESLAYLHEQQVGPPYIQLSLRKKVYCLQDLIRWMETRKRNK